MGEIYLAEDELLGRQVAVKLLAEHLSRDRAIRKRFKREALTAARLSGHPHIVTIFDVGECEGRPFIVMEYLSGGTLGQRARDDRIEPRQMIDWLREAGGALDDAHHEGIVHRDVKPANLLLDSRDSVHVADFGIARVVDETTGMTASGTVMGTAGYLAPEQARGEPATAASDRYALGVVAYELLTGGRPFERGSATAEAAAHIHEPVPPASERGVGIPAAADRILERALAKDPRERYPSSRDFVRELCRALGLDEQPTQVIASAAPRTDGSRTEVGAAAAPVRVGPPRRAGGRRRSLVPLIVGALVVLGGGGALLGAVLAGGGDGNGAPPKATTIIRTVKQPGKKSVETVTATVQTSTSPTGGGNLSIDQAIALTDQATYRMRGGAYGQALPLALKAFDRLKGTGNIYEAYSAYDAGRSYAELGNCAKALPLLKHAEKIEGHNSSIDAARAKCK
jgi:predicted Ser/Thr protein kinase